MRGATEGSFREVLGGPQRHYQSARGGRAPTLRLVSANCSLLIAALTLHTLMPTIFATSLRERSGRFSARCLALRSLRMGIVIGILVSVFLKTIAPRTKGNRYKKVPPLGRDRSCCQELWSWPIGSTPGGA